jgi:hypothetical protein
MQTLRQTLETLVGVALLATAIGCATSIQPLASEAVLTDLPGIEGKWVVSHSPYLFLKKGAQIGVTRCSVGRYEVEFEQNGKTARWHADAVLLEKAIYLDLFPNVETDRDAPELALQVSTHVILALSQNESTLKLYTFDIVQLERLAAEQGLTVPISNGDGNGARVVFIADAGKLQAFFRKHGPALRSTAPTFVLERQ